MVFGRTGGILEILLILIIILILFGPSRIAKVTRELGRSIAAFREGLNEKPNDTPAGGPDPNEPKE